MHLPLWSNADHSNKRTLLETISNCWFSFNILIYYDLKQFVDASKFFQHKKIVAEIQFSIAMKHILYQKDMFWLHSIYRFFF